MICYLNYYVNIIKLRIKYAKGCYIFYIYIAYPYIIFLRFSCTKDNKNNLLVK